ncbi:MAG: DJ-1/PfpI family protein [Candidatus Odinarchaeota archaeon]
MKLKAISLVSLIILVVIVSNPVLVPSVDGQDVSDIKVLMLISDYFGWNYFGAKEVFESWGANVTTIASSLDADVPSCLNKPPRGTTADLLLSQVENNIVNQFDVLLIPAGGQWQSLVQSTRVLEFIEYAHDNGKIVAAICIGNIVLSRANNVVNGSNVVSYPETNTDMAIAGAAIRRGYCAVTDNRFITGGTGGGPTGGGNEVAPTRELCIAVARESLGYSYCRSATISPQSGIIRTNFTITAEVTDLDTELDSITVVNCNISSVTAQIYTKSDRTLIDTVELVNENDDGVYSGEFMALSNGEYVIDIEIEDTNHTLEVERVTASFSVGAGFTIEPLILGIIAISTVLAVVVIILVKRK